MNWLGKHREIFDDDGNLTRHGRQLYAESTPDETFEPDPRFRLCYVTESTHAFVKALECACVAFGEARDPETWAQALTAISLAREALYQHCERLESGKAPKESRSVVLRF